VFDLSKIIMCNPDEWMKELLDKDGKGPYYYFESSGTATGAKSMS
jgi:hypothetical protein